MQTVSAQPVPPSADQLLQYVNAHAPVQSTTRRYAFFILLGLLVGALLVGNISVPLQMLMVLAAMGLLGWIVHQRRAAMQVQQQLQQVQEMVLMRHDNPAATLAWQLIPKVRHLPDAHVQAVMYLAVSCARLEAYDTAIAAQGYLLQHIPPAHPTTQLIRLQQVMAMLHEDHLVDADDAIRRLARADLPDAGHAMLKLAALYQQIKTHHHADVVEQANQIASMLRLLGVEAAYGYAMIATAFAHQQQTDQAQQWWRKATLLLSPDVIMHEIPETAVLADLPAEPSLMNCMEQDRHG